MPNSVTFQEYDYRLIFSREEDYNPEEKFYAPSARFLLAGDGFAGNIVYTGVFNFLKDDGSWDIVKAGAFIVADPEHPEGGFEIYRQGGAPVSVRDGGNAADMQPAVAEGAALGSDFTTALNGNDAGGKVQFTATAPLSTADTIITLTFGRPFPNGEVYVYVKPLNAISQALFTSADFLVIDQSATTFSLFGKLVAGANYAFAYRVAPKVGT